MEQKKILFVVAAVSVFALVIFGFALVISSPARTATEAERQTASAAIPGRTAEITRRAAAEDVAVDPDAWIRSPEAAPGLDAELEPVAEAESLTSISPAYIASAAESQEAESAPATETISVRELASRPAQAGRAPRAQVEGTAEAQGNGAAAASTIERSGAQSASVAAKPAQVETRAPAQANSASKGSSRETARQTVVEYWIQTGSFASKLNAESARKMLTERYLNAEIFTKEINGSQTYRVRVGPYADKAEADYWLGTIAETPEFSGSYVSRVTAQR